MHFSILKSFSEQDLADLQMLMAQLSPGLELTREHLQEVLDNPSVRLCIARMPMTPNPVCQSVFPAASSAQEGETSSVAILAASSAQEGGTSSGAIPAAASIVGCAVLAVYESMCGRLGRVEDVVVLDSCRGRGIGRSLMEFVLSEASKLAPLELQLTSKPVRVAANALYRSLGFELKQTNCYVKKCRF